MYEGCFFGPGQGGTSQYRLYIARNNKARALTFVGELRQTATDIGLNPLAYPLLPRFEDRRIRRRVFRDYLIFYRADADAVYIVHILHGAQDYEALLSPPA